MPTPIIPRILAPVRSAGRLLILAALAGLAACARLQSLPTDPAATSVRSVPALAPSPAGCLVGQAAEMVWPQLSGLQPQPVAAGSDVTVIASGGYVKCGASGINESARSFQLDLDGAPLGLITCYINHCEDQFRLPASVAPGAHVLAVEGGSQVRLDVR